MNDTVNLPQDMASQPSVQRWLLYDRDCGFCRHWVNWACQRGADTVIRFVPCQEAAQLREPFEIPDADCTQWVFLLVYQDNKPHAQLRGAAAINAVLKQLPGPRHGFWRFVGRLYAIPGLQQLENWGYIWTAKNRSKIGRWFFSPKQ